jgi:hypothetical protein
MYQRGGGYEKIAPNPTPQPSIKVVDDDGYQKIKYPVYMCMQLTKNQIATRPSESGILNFIWFSNTRTRSHSSIPNASIRGEWRVSEKQNTRPTQGGIYILPVTSGAVNVEVTGIKKQNTRPTQGGIHYHQWHLEL